VATASTWQEALDMAVMSADKPPAPLGSLALKVSTQGRLVSPAASADEEGGEEDKTELMQGCWVAESLGPQGRAALGTMVPFYAKHFQTMSAYKTWMCLICGWVYDEAAGAPEHGLAPGTRWEDVPMNWTCPECGGRKEDFEMVAL